MYKGQFLKNKFDGPGEYTYKSGKVFVGSFKEGKKHGKGVITFPNGSTYNGNWDMDVEIGAAVYTNKHKGKSVIGTWDLNNKSFVPKMNSQIS